MPVSPERFRRVLATLAGGVAVVTSRRADGTPSGLTATAVCSVSLDPPLVLACLGRETNTHAAIAGSGMLALNFLSREDAALARRFAGEGEDKFVGVATSRQATGAPVLDAALAWCDCSVVRSVPAGDHTIFVGSVEAAGLGARADDRPLVYFRGRYGSHDPGGEG